ncbi:hypothetical protein TNCV_1058711 [Trichonephila clavipes]|nr:hypothetical protein TNCV_1058711 [Trichonephila clavipes]
MFFIENIYYPVHHEVSHGCFHRSKREAHITKKRKITRQKSMSYPRFEPRPYGTEVSVTVPDGRTSFEFDKRILADTIE